MNIGGAIQAIKEGKRARRRGWNGKGMWIAYSPGGGHLAADKFWSPANQEYARSQPDGCADVLPCVTMKTASGEILMGWLASQSDLLAEDWEIA